MVASPPDTVISELHYIVPPADGEKAFQVVNYESNKPEPGNVGEAMHNVVIENICGEEHLYTLDNAGFQFFRRPSKYLDLDDSKEREEYHRESGEIVKEITGATHVVLYEPWSNDSPTVRRLRPGVGEPDWKKRRPAAQVHVDVSTSAAIETLHEHAPPEIKDTLHTRRFQMINLWRPIKHAAYDWPLALCTYDSVDLDSDLFTILRKHGEIGVKYNPNHRWKYLRGMTPDDILLLKNYDTDNTVAVFSPHAAFEDPTTPEGTPPRESIELRFLVIYN
ncbi:hypothetical protein L218DRAFT_873960 [Marasmius fiardii PR-910]|nr:hypothetical protein L218DRAFT_873960 [Marasmius fiardii PR-910]